MFVGFASNASEKEKRTLTSIILFALMNVLFFTGDPKCDVVALGLAKGTKIYWRRSASSQTLKKRNKAMNVRRSGKTFHMDKCLSLHFLNTSFKHSFFLHFSNVFIGN